MCSRPRIVNGRLQGVPAAKCRCSARCGVGGPAFCLYGDGVGTIDFGFHDWENLRLTGASLDKAGAIHLLKRVGNIQWGCGRPPLLGSAARLCRALFQSFLVRCKRSPQRLQVRIFQRHHSELSLDLDRLTVLCREPCFFIPSGTVRLASCREGPYGEKVRVDLRAHWLERAENTEAAPG